LFFCSPFGLFHHDPKLHYRNPHLVPSRQLHRDQQVLVHLPGLAKNEAPRHGRQLIKPPGR
jgi:hypothetical protein